jgi:hypothetical protein
MVDAMQIAADLEKLAIEEISTLISLNSSEKSFSAYGPLAPILVPLIQKRRPDLEFRLRPNLIGCSFAAVSKGLPS